MFLKCESLLKNGRLVLMFPSSQSRRLQILIPRILILFVNYNFIFGLQLQGRKWGVHELSWEAI